MYKLINGMDYNYEPVGAIDAIKALDKRVTVLEIRNFGLEEASTIDELIAMVKSIKQPIRTLLLDSLNLGSYDNAALSRLMSALPASITHLSINNNELGQSVNRFEEDVDFIASIPASVIILNLEGNDFGPNCAAPQLQRFLHTIPPQVRQLTLATNGLNEIQSDDLKKVFAAIPSWVSSVDLRNNDLDCGRLATALPALEFVKWLNLCSNALYDNSELLEKVFTNLPPKIRRLGLTYCAINIVPHNRLVDSFSKLPKTLQSLDLSSNRLSELSSRNLVKLLKTIGLAPISHLNLSSNDLRYYYDNAMLNHLDTQTSPDDAELPPLNARDLTYPLTDVLRNIPASVTSVDLRYNNLERLEEPTITRVFEALPKTVKNHHIEPNKAGTAEQGELVTLNLRKRSPNSERPEIAILKGLKASTTEVAIGFMAPDINMDELTVTKHLDAILEAIPTQVKTLHLLLGKDAINWLPEMVSALNKAPHIDKLVCKLDSEILFDLKYLFRNLPPEIAEVELDFNYPELIDVKALADALSFLPTQLRELRLRMDNLSSEDCMSITAHCVMNNSRVTLMFRGERIKEWTDFVLEQFTDSVGSYLSNDSHIDRYNSRAFLFLKEHQTRSLISRMERHQSPFAQLFCAFLLEGRLENCIEGDFSDEELRKAMDKRLEDAIAFYVRASASKTLFPVITMLLWQYKICSIVPSISQRLAAFDVNPSYYSTQFVFFNPEERAVRMPLCKPLELMPAEVDIEIGRAG